MREHQPGVRTLGPAWWRGAAALLALSALTGCGASEAKGVRLWTASYAFGTLGQREFDVRRYCGERGARKLQVLGTPATLVVGVITLGVYTPREVRIECR